MFTMTEWRTESCPVNGKVMKAVYLCECVCTWVCESVRSCMCELCGFKYIYRDKESYRELSRQKNYLVTSVTHRGKEERNIQITWDVTSISYHITRETQERKRAWKYVYNIANRAAPHPRPFNVAQYNTYRYIHIAFKDTCPLTCTLRKRRSGRWTHTAKRVGI